MGAVGQREILTQRHVLRFFEDELGYRYLGNWKDRIGNANVEKDLLGDWLRRRGQNDAVIARVLREVDQAKALGGGKNLYDANKAVFGLLRYGVKVSPEVGEQHQTVWLIDWANPAANDFAVAEEVTVAGEHDKRPDVVLYVNGIALGVLELKRSTVSVGEGIRQQLDSQKPEFIASFYATVQLVLAGNETQGLRYGVIGIPEKYWLTWKEEGLEANPLDRALRQLCRKERLLELIHDFMVFDAGTKKTSRHNQYFGVRAAQAYVERRQGGIVWHTQGSGKSLTMVWLANWIREHVTGGRVLIITDRNELDEQIERVFLGVDESIYRTNSGEDLLATLERGEESLICSLVHKFGGSEEGDVEGFARELAAKRRAGFAPKGEIFVFVDECHRTQSGTLHAAMTELLPGATLIGFTGTPLLKRDKQQSVEVFGPYIHTYKYDEAVRDGVVLDLLYEARDIDQEIMSPARIDEWFEIKTKGLTDVAKAQLKERWGTLKKVLSSRDRLEKIVADILLDMERHDRLLSGQGNAILVSDSIYSATRFYAQFEETDLRGKVAIVTSYKPSPADIKGEETGEGLTEKLAQYDIYRRMLADHFGEPEDLAMGKVEVFDRQVKKRFIEEPGQMKLLIVVDKLLTGFDAPAATYLYIDKQMRDHGLFQAICRVNRLDGEDKKYGYVIDYKDLFHSLERSITDYTGEAFAGFDAADVAGLLSDRLEKARERLDGARDDVAALCEPVVAPRNSAAYIHFFCDREDAAPEASIEHERRRILLYKLTPALLRAYANLANEMDAAGYSEAETAAVKAEVEHYEKVRAEVKLASGDYIDLKLYEPAMRHLLDSYIRAEESTKLSAFDDMTLVELIVERGEGAVAALPAGIRESPEAVAETIENNVRKLIVDEMAANPKYYGTMSALLDTLVAERRRGAIAYKEYLAKIVALTRRVTRPEAGGEYPTTMDTGARRALYDNLERDEGLALRVDEAILAAKHADWRGNRLKERVVRNAIASVIEDGARVEAIFELAKNQREY